MNDSAPTVTILKGHVLDKLKELPDQSVHMCMTSPPYWGLRDYSRCGCAIKSAPVTRAMNEEEAMEKYGRTDFRSSRETNNDGQVGSALKSDPDPNCPKCHGTGKDDSLEVDWPVPGDGWKCDEATRTCRYRTGLRCSWCPGERTHPDVPWRGQLGLESTPDLYVQHIVQVFREVRRVLRDDGTLWLNMGDCYTASQGLNADGSYRLPKIPTFQQDNPEPRKETGEHMPAGWTTRKVTSRVRPIRGNNLGLKPKDLVGMPWRVAFALQADGWYLRSDIIWAKPNPMPESV